ncbi:hypothetical protein [Planctomycetes bacterium K23_9]|uniref:hypothetical protein n=1 Tax=Stieleria marina TaxID=1930275 RepID=UPI0011A6E177
MIDSRFLVAIILATLATPAVVRADGFSGVVQRQTDDRDQDLIEALITHRRFVEAKEICSSEFLRFDAKSDEAAKWAIRWSNVLVKEIESGGKFDNQSIEKCREPITTLVDRLGSLKTLDDHRRSAFLGAQTDRIRASIARQVVVAASVSPSTERRVEDASSIISQATQGFVDLAKVVDGNRASMDTKAITPEEKAFSADLKRLHNELRIEIVSLALLQTDVFPPGSRDRTAAASRAQREADTAFKELPIDSPARLEIERLRTTAILRTGDLQLAERSLAELATKLPRPIPHRVMALRIDLDLAQGNRSKAAERLGAFYGTQPDDAPLSVEMDLARLAYLIDTRNKSVGQWLTSISARHGAYARRRAEAISLGNLRAKGTDDAIDPAIIAAQGADWLRRGDSARAGALLAAAAKAERDDDLAINYAIKSAAAFVKAKQPAQAAATLTAVTIAHSAAKQAANAHLQAAVVLSQIQQDGAAKDVENALLQTQKTWPESDAAAKARQWVITLLARQDRLQEAAQLATSFLNDASTSQEIAATIDAWMKLVVDSNESVQAKTLSEFQLAFESLKQFPAIARGYAFAEAFLLDVNQLSDTQSIPKATNIHETFAADLAGFRRNQTVTDTLKSPPERRRDIAQWRLMRDGKLNPKHRSTIAQLISSWDAGWEQQIPLLVWAGKREQAETLAKETAAAADQPAPIWKLLANTLANSQNRTDQLQGVQVWDQLAAGLPKSSVPWHEAKLGAIELLIKLGEQADAQRRAKYVLLTNSPADATLRQRYESAVKK